MYRSGRGLPARHLPAGTRYAERDFTNIIHWTEFDRGGHFAAVSPDTAGHTVGAPGGQQRALTRTKG